MPSSCSDCSSRSKLLSQYWPCHQKRILSLALMGRRSEVKFSISWLLQTPSTQIEWPACPGDIYTNHLVSINDRKTGLIDAILFNTTAHYCWVNYCNWYRPSISPDGCMDTFGQTDWFDLLKGKLSVPACLFCNI